jgi:hypothetical protein
VLNSLCLSEGRILGRNWDKSLKSFPPCYSQSPLLQILLPLPSLSNSGLKLVCNVNIVYGNLKSENSHDYAQKPQRNCTFMNSAAGYVSRYCQAAHFKKYGPSMTEKELAPPPREQALSHL